MPIADVAERYTDLVTTVFSSTIAAKAFAVQQGRGVMPAGIVTGQEQADVVAYVVSISSPDQ